MRLASIQRTRGAGTVRSPHTLEAPAALPRAARRARRDRPRVFLAFVPGASTLDVGDFAKLDLGRTERTGLPEVVWGPGKTPVQILEIMLALRDRQHAVMATRVDPETFDAIRALYDETHHQKADETKNETNTALEYDPVSRVVQLTHDRPNSKTPKRVVVPGVLVVLTAGTADLAVAQEAATTARGGCNEVRVVADPTSPDYRGCSVGGRDPRS